MAGRGQPLVKDGRRRRPVSLAGHAIRNRPGSAAAPDRAIRRRVTADFVIYDTVVSITRNDDDDDGSDVEMDARHQLDRIRPPGRIQ